MNNSLLQYELQDICTFRQIIVNSNQKIQHHLLRKKCPIQLVQHCDFTEPNNYYNPQFECGYDDKTTDYFSESEYQPNPTVNGFYQSQSKDHYLTNYINQYEMNKVEFSLGPLMQRRDIQNRYQNRIIERKETQNRYQNYMTPLSSRKRAQFRPVEFPMFQNIHLQHRQAIRNNSTVQKRTFDYQNMNVNRIQYDDFVKDDRSYFEQKKTEKQNKIKFLSNINMVPQSQRKLLRTPRRENPIVSTQKKLSKNKNKKISIDKQTNKKSVQKKDMNQISLSKFSSQTRNHETNPTIFCSQQISIRFIFGSLQKGTQRQMLNYRQNNESAQRIMQGTKASSFDQKMIFNKKRKWNNFL